MNSHSTQRSTEASNEPPIDDIVWSSLNDRSRRTILDLLRAGSLTTGQLCTHFETSRFAVMKHLKELQKAGLVIAERRGRERLNHLNPVPIQNIYQRWIRPFEQLSAERMLQIKQIAERGGG